MKLSDINQTTFASLSPEVQAQIIEANQIDPIIAGLVIFMVIAPLFFMR